MAIVIEEEQSHSISLMTLVVWVIVIGVVGTAGYYLFFKNPELISFTAPSGFKNTEAVSKIDLNPEGVVRSPQFQILKQYVAPPDTSRAGRKNPFLGF